MRPCNRGSEHLIKAISFGGRPTRRGFVENPAFLFIGQMLVSIKHREKVLFVNPIHRHEWRHRMVWTFGKDTCKRWDAIWGRWHHVDCD